MRWVSLLTRRPVVAGAAALMIAALCGVVSADAAANTDHPRELALPAAAAARNAPASQPKSPDEFSSTANPLTLDPPVKVPPTKPVVVTIADSAAFGNAPPPATATVNLPHGNWASVVLDITGTETGTQYDRLCEVFDGPSQIFLGVTPEPTQAGISWHVQKDITGYLPILRGTQTFSTEVDNYTSAADNGIPTLTVKLLFYPAGGGFTAARPASLTAPGLAGDALDEAGPATPAQHPGVPTDVVPVLPTGATSTFNTINAGATQTATVTLPDNVTTATLDLYAAGQINDEFWWAEEPAFREIEVSIDGKPAGVVWPYPYVYTGGVNPLIWRPVTGIGTMDIPSYRVDLTPFAGLLSGTHTISLTVVNNTGYWLAGGSLLLTAGGRPTSGSVTSDTLSFPASSQVTTSNALGSASQPVTSESAAASYAISGKITQGGRSWTDALNGSLQLSDDQSSINPTCNGACYQWVHGEETQSASSTLTGPGADVSTSNSSDWTIDAPNAYLPNADGSDFFLPASVSQQLTIDASQHGGFLPEFRTHLSESIIGYGALENDNGTASITDGDTTGTVTDQASRFGDVPASVYQRTVVAHGGQVVQDLATSG